MHAKHADGVELNDLSGRVVGTYCVNPLIEDVLLVELKIVNALDDAHHVPGTNYLMATCLMATGLQPAGNRISVSPTRDRKRGTQPVKHAEPSACFACIFLYLR
jgi:hypothetical protein